MSKSFEQIAKELDASREIITNGVDVLSKFIDKQAGQIADRDQRIAALEARVSELQDECVRFVAELDPWRQMARQLEALRVPTFDEAFNVEVYGDRGNDAWSVYLFDADGGKYVGTGATLPAAVAAAYARVVGDE